MRAKIRIRKIKTAYSGMNDKRNAIIDSKNELEAINRQLKKQIKIMSSKSAERKDSDFYKRLNGYKQTIEDNLEKCASYKNSIHRLNESIKNRNLHLSNGIIK